MVSTSNQQQLKRQKPNLGASSNLQPDTSEGASPGITGWIFGEFWGNCPIGDTTGTASDKINKQQLVNLGFCIKRETGKQFKLYICKLHTR